MILPFTYEEFLEVFKNYNLAVFPAQLIAFILGLTSLMIFLVRKTYGNIVNVILGIFWVFTGVFYHFLYFSEINKAAYFFGILFVAQGFLFFRNAFHKQKIKYHLDLSEFNIRQFFAVIFFLYALFIYPLLSQIFGHHYPFSPAFGITPCPTVIFTFAFFLLSENRLPFQFWVIPVIWAIIGFFAATQLGMIEDFGLTATAVISVFLITRKKRKSVKKPENIEKKLLSFRHK